MVRRIVIGGAAAVCALCAPSFTAQEVPKIDFVRDVQPILRQNCYGCHGPTQQMNGFRLDRRRDALRGGTLAVIGPGNSDGSRMYLRLVGDRYGTQMPPTGALRPEQIATIKAWIDQGAAWPDEAAGETPPKPMDAKAAQLMDAALGGDAATVASLLKAGVDADVRNEAGATPLMRAVGDLATTRLLLEYGADVNARSDDRRTPLLIASGLPGAGAVVRLLLEYGADPSVKAPGLFFDTTPLAEAAYSGDEGVFRLLVDAGADMKAAGPLALGFALRAQCMPCVETLLKAADPGIVTGAMMLGGPPNGPALATPLLLEHDADFNARDQDGRTALMLAAASEALPVDAVTALIARGADVNATNAKGETALSLAKLRGNTPVVALLMKAGAKDVPAPAGPSVKPVAAVSARAAVERSLPLLQQNDSTFLRKAGCVSCHNNTLTAMTVGAARKRGFKVNEQIAQQQLRTISNYLDTWRERALQGVGIPGDADTVSYIMLGLAAENHPPDAATDAQARLLKREQTPSGNWRILAHRPPLESNDIEVTAASMRALQLYAPQSEKAAYQQAVQRAAAWLVKAEPHSTEERAFQLLGFGWARSGKAAIDAAARALAAEQRADGGWAQIPSLSSDAYATGQALVALRESGAVAATDPVLKRGVDFLLKTQFADGSWYVRTRALPIQPHFESGFPYGRDQFISAAATNWATMALAAAAKPRS